jgi:ATP-dependent Clp protease protease subunit
MLINLLDLRYLHLFGSISYDRTTSFASSFKELEGDDRMPYIPVMIHSGGGLTHCGHFISDLMQHCTKTVITVGLGETSSAAAIILASGSKGFRFALDYSLSILHYATEDGQEQSLNYKDNKSENDRYFNTLEVLSGTKKSIFKKLIRTHNGQVILNGAGQKQYGIIDHIGYPIIELNGKKVKGVKKK